MALLRQDTNKNIRLYAKGVHCTDCCTNKTFVGYSICNNHTEDFEFDTWDKVDAKWVKLTGQPSWKTIPLK